jgi:2-hydroxy-3-keto-5-methylthiopentenyl-1-phosphate phosphatase
MGRFCWRRNREFTLCAKENALKLAIFTDYDGTITTKDTIDLMLDKYGAKDWYAVSRALDKKGANNIERMTAEFADFKITREKIRELIVAEVGIDETFKSFLAYARMRGWLVTVLSQGVRESVETIFGKYGIDGVEYHANCLCGEEGNLHIAFPEKDSIIDDGCHDNCGVCKSGHVRRAKRNGYTTVYIGDGITDRCPAAEADIVFAKKYLKKYMTQNNLPFVPFETFDEIEKALAERFPAENEVHPEEVRTEE